LRSSSDKSTSLDSLSRMSLGMIKQVQDISISPFFNVLLMGLYRFQSTHAGLSPQSIILAHGCADEGSALFVDDALPSSSRLMDINTLTISN
jgi:hypothetical protein